MVATDWDDYRERVEQYFVANDISEEKKRAVFLTCCGPEMYALLRRLLSPLKPSATALPAIFDALTKHFSPKPSEVVASYRFFSRSRNMDEPVADFVTSLNRLAEDCNFGGFRERMLRDRIVGGINDDAMRTRLLEIPDLSLETAKNTVVAIEAARRDSQALEARPTAPTNALGHVDPVCFRCGAAHYASKCVHKNSVCHKCGTKGHFARMCKDKKAKSSKLSKGRQRRVHKLNDCPETEDVSPPVYDMWQVKKSATDSQPFKVEVSVNSVILVMELDTGASVTIVAEDTFRKAFPERQLECSNVLLKSYNGELSPVLGKLTCSVDYKGRSSVLPLFVVPGKCPSLLGRDWIEALGITLFKPRDLKGVSTVGNVANRYSEVFSSGMGTFRGVKAKIHIKAGAQPQFFRPRPVPFALQDRVNEELQRMEREHIISPVQTADWAAPIVPVLKSDGRVRICGDFKVTVNPVTELERYPIPRVEELFAKLSGGLKFSKLDL